jgi:hypothetical protein
MCIVQKREEYHHQIAPACAKDGERERGEEDSGFDLGGSG